MQAEATGQRPDHLTIEEAADRLGIRPEAVRSRLRRGKLSGIRTGTGWRVFLPAEEAEEAPPEADRSADQIDRSRPDSDRSTDQRLADIEAERDWLRAEVERRGVELAEMRRLLAAALTPRQLPAGTPVDVEPVNGPVVTGQTPESQPRRAWWRFWR